jgi:acyl-CoA thioesterase
MSSSSPTRPSPWPATIPGSITVASGGDIDFLKPTFIGDELVAHGREVVKQGRSGIYDVTVTRGDEIIATYRGRSRTLPPRSTVTGCSRAQR